MVIGAARVEKMTASRCVGRRRASLPASVVCLFCFFKNLGSVTLIRSSGAVRFRLDEAEKLHLQKKNEGLHHFLHLAAIGLLIVID